MHITTSKFELQYFSADCVIIATFAIGNFYVQLNQSLSKASPDTTQKEKERHFGINGSHFSFLLVFYKWFNTMSTIKKHDCFILIKWIGTEQWDVNPVRKVSSAALAAKIVATPEDVVGKEISVTWTEKKKLVTRENFWK